MDGARENEVYDFGLSLKRLREKRGLTQDQAGEILGVSRKSMSNYETNINMPRPEVLKGMAVLYRTSIDEIMGFHHRPAIYLDDFTKEEQEMMRDVVERIREGLHGRK